MCGIAGIVTGDENRVLIGQLRSMTDALKHRGPEGEGFWIDNEAAVGLGHRRLSIIDLSQAGAQPMWYANRYVITYNGEIYNYLELKQDLQQQGYTFSSQCDTEVLVAAYACYGINCLQMFDGMFSFAIWDTEEKILFCARDRFGEKPFYYYHTPGSDALFFASEMKGLWAAGVPKSMNNRRLLNYLTLGWVQNPLHNQETFYEEIISLPPSHYLVFKPGEKFKPRLHITRYWQLHKNIKKHNYSDNEACEHFLALLTSSVKRRLRSDVAIGSSLSGGIDSSSIVSITKQLLGGGVQQQTFSAIFPGFERDESLAIGRVAQHCRVQNFTTSPSAADLIRDCNLLMYHQEEPFQSASIYAQYAVYQLAKKKQVTVILDGQGADEILGGYKKYHQWYWRELLANIKPGKLSNEIKNTAGVNARLLSILMAACPPVTTAWYLKKKALKQQRNHPFIAKAFFSEYHKPADVYKPVVHTLNDILHYNTMQYGLEELLRYADRNAMAHSREVRLPFLNHDLVQFVFSLPSHHKIRNGYTKFVLRAAMANRLPNAIVWQKNKIGYEPPQKEWMQHGDMQEHLHESRKLLVQAGILNQQVLQHKIQPTNAHEGENYEWRYFCAAQYL